MTISERQADSLLLEYRHARAVQFAQTSASTRDRHHQRDRRSGYFGAVAPPAIDVARVKRQAPQQSERVRSRKAMAR